MIDAARLDALRHRGDPAADAAIEASVEEQGGDRLAAASALLDELLRWVPGDTPPPTAVREFAERPAPGLAADGCDLRVRHGQRVFRARELQAFLILGLASLPACYAIPEVASTLMLEGRLAHRVDRRLRETAQFVDAVMEPGGFCEGGTGLAWCRKVRLVHAAMRLLARAEPPTEPERQPRPGTLQDFLIRQDPGQRDADPIDQVELAFVLQTFGWLTVRSWRRVGVGPSPTEIEDYLFTWSSIGRELGIDDALLPSADTCTDDARALFDTALERYAGGTRDGRLLTAALLVLVRESLRHSVPRLDDPERRTTTIARRIPGPLRRLADRLVAASLPSLPRSYMRRLLGRRLAAELDVSRAPLGHWLIHVVAMRVLRIVGRNTIDERGGTFAWLARHAGPPIHGRRQSRAASSSR